MMYQPGTAKGAAWYHQIPEITSFSGTQMQRLHHTVWRNNANPLVKLWVRRANREPVEASGVRS